MQLDKTRIVIRERSAIEIVDLALQVLRSHGGALLKPAIVGILPLLVLNYVLIGRMAIPATEQLAPIDYIGRNFRYVFGMGLLVFLQAPLATGLMTVYLGMLMFMPNTTLRDVLRDFRSTWAPFVWTIGIRRLALPASFLFLLVTVEEYHPAELSVTVAALLAAVLRSWRPYLPEIVLLEKIPLRSAGPGSISVGKRSARLHSGAAGAGGELFPRWIGACLIHGLLLYVAMGTLVFLQGVLWDSWQLATPWMLYVAYPAVLWMLAIFSAVCRYLNYLDARIRNEGWEVYLLLRAEGERLREVPSAG